MKKSFFFICILVTALSIPNFVLPIDIIEAAKWGDVGKVKQLLAKNPGLIKVTDDGLGATALHWAAIYGRREVVKIILSFKPDVNTQEKHGGTTMHWAAHFDDPEVIGWLLDHGATIDHINQYGRTPLLVAARRGCNKVIQILHKRGANIQATLKNGSTALHIAAKNGHTSVIKYLISQGLDSEIINKHKQTYRDVLSKRQKPIKIDPKIIHNYAGLYKRTDGRLLDIRAENNRLFYYAYGKDELLPISQVLFITSAELKYFTFIKNDNGKVTQVLYKIGTREIRAKKLK